MGRTGQSLEVKNLPSPGRAERNQRRKLEFIPIWPIAGAVLVFVAIYLFAR